VGEWVKDGITDQTTSAMQVTKAKRRLAMSFFVLLKGKLPCTIDMLLGEGIPSIEPSGKTARSRSQPIEQQPFNYAAA
jgi:hypothetical protein